MFYATEPSLDWDQGHAPLDDVPSTRPAPVDDGIPATASPSIDDSGQGQALFVLFVMAVLFVTGAVALLALVTSWWLLGLAFGVHVLVTTIVSAAVFTVLSSGKLTRKGAARTPAGATPGLADPVKAKARSSHASPLPA